MRNPITNPQLSAMRFWWVLANVIAWGTSHKLLLTESLQPTSELIPATIVVVLNGLLTGIILGVGEWIALRQIWDQADGWFHATAWSQAIGIAIGWTLAIAYVMRWPIQIEGTGTSIAPSRILVLSVLGTIVGVSQWLVLRQRVPRHFKHGMLWALGTIAGLTVGWFVGSMAGVFTSFSFVIRLMGQDTLRHFSIYSDISNIVSGIVMGLFSGGLTSSILLLLIQRSAQTNLRPTPSSISVQ
jgi:hypothetical protein